MTARARGIAAGVAVAAVGIGARVAIGASAGAVQSADGVSEMRAWLGWQLWDNVRAGRGPFDATIFVEGPASLLAIAPNPGAALVTAALHGGLAPEVVGVVALAAVLVLNALAGGLYGARHGLPWLGALAAGVTWWGAHAQTGGAAQALLAPGLLAALAWHDGRRALALGLALVGAAVAPAPTFGLLVGAGALPLAALAASGFLVPAFGTTAGPALAPGDLVWPAGRAVVAAPLAAWIALAGLWAAGHRGRAVVAALALVAALAPLPVAGFTLRVPWAAGAAPASVAFGLLLAAGLPAAAAGLSNGRRVLLGAVLLLDVAGPLVAGAAAGGAPLPPAPAGFAALAGSPRRAEVLVVGGREAPALGVGWIPVHQQLAGLAPTPAAPREAPPAPRVVDHVNRSPRPVVLVWLSPDAAATSALATSFGAPASVDAAAAVWR